MKILKAMCKKCKNMFKRMGGQVKVICPKCKEEYRVEDKKE